MASIIPFLPDGMHLRDSVFEAHELKAMSAAFYEVCEAMNLQDDSSAKQIIAARIIDLVRRGECVPQAPLRQGSARSELGSTCA